MDQWSAWLFRSLRAGQDAHPSLPDGSTAMEDISMVRSSAMGDGGACNFFGAAFSGLLVAFSGGLWPDSSTDVKGDFKVRDDEFTAVVNMDAARYLKIKDQKKKGSESTTRQLTSVNPETCQLAQPPAFGMLQNQGFMLPTPALLPGGMPSDNWHTEKKPIALLL